MLQNKYKLGLEPWRPYLRTPDRAIREVGRSLFGKSWVLPGEERAVFTSIVPIHVPSDVKAWKKEKPFRWHNADPRLVLDHGKYRTLCTWYDIEIDPKSCSFKYRSKVEGEVSVSLWAIGGEFIGAKTLNIKPVVHYNQLWFRQIVPGVDIYIQCDVGRVEVFKVLYNDRAPRTFTWHVDDSKKASLRVGDGTYGVDNFLRKIRTPAAPIRAPRAQYPIRCVWKREGSLVTEEWTGEVVERDDDRTPHRSKGAIYPIWIDQPDITETIADQDDDGKIIPANERWYRTIIFMATNYGAWRFQGVGGGSFGNGATIGAATNLRLYVASGGSSPPSSGPTFSGEDIGTAPPWVHLDTISQSMMQPYNRTSTYYSAVIPWTVYSWNALLVSGIVQDIVNNPGWADSNDMRLWHHDFLSSGESRILTATANPVTGNVGQLEIYYTPPAGGVPIPVIMRSNETIQ